MTNDPRIGDAAHALWRSNVLDSLTGSYVESGLDAAPGSSGSSIQVEVDPGDVRLNDNPVSVAGDTLTLDQVGTTDEYRSDVVFATSAGGLAVKKGVSAQPKPTIDDDDPYPTGDPQPARRLFSPAPADGSAINGLPLHVVVVADTASDSTDLALEDLVDYRIPAPLPGDHVHPELALNHRTTYLSNTSGDQYVKIATVNDGSTNLGRYRVRLWSGNDVTSSSPRALDAYLSTRRSVADVEALAYGSRASATDVVLTEESAANAGTNQSRYHCYLYLPGGARTYLQTTNVGNSFGENQLIKGLGSNDLIGTTVHDTGGSTGGPGGERQVPKAPGAVRSDVEGTTDVDDLSSANAPAVDAIARAQGDGTVAWDSQALQSGDWEPLAAIPFPATTYTRSTGGWAAVTSRAEGLPLASERLVGRHHAEIGLMLAGVIQHDGESGAEANARLAYNTTGTQIGGTRISTTSSDPDLEHSGLPASLRGNVEEIVHLEMNPVSTAEARVDRPTVHIYGQIA